VLTPSLLVALALLGEVDGGAAEAAPEIRKPEASCETPVKYPAAEAQSGVRGTVLLRVTLSAEGTLSTTEVVQSLGSAFDDAAIAFAKACAFTPAAVNGVPAPSLMELSLEFVPPVRPWTLTGRVVGELGEALNGAVVSLGGQSARTDADGHFTLTFDAVPPGDAWVTVAKEGYALKGFPELFKPGRTTEVRYALARERIFETRVKGSRLLPPVPDADRTPQVSHYSISRADIDRNPGALEDVARVVQQLPGVAADPDLLANFFVRGGGPDEVLFVIDGVPLANPYHLGGFASIINPMMVESADFYAGGTPAWYEPTLSGALEIKYSTGETKRPRVMADVSFLSAKARADIPLGIDGLNAVVSFRRSFFESYFAVMKALHVFGADVVAPDITEGFARVTYRHGAHQTMLTFIHASDGLNFIIKPGEEVLVNFAGGLKLANMSDILSLQHKVDLGGDSELSFTTAYTHDFNQLRVDSTRRLSNDSARDEVLVRADLKLAHSAKHRSAFGVQYAWRKLALSGEVGDTRGVAPWEQEPFAETYRPYVDIEPRLLRNLASVYAEHTWRPVDVFSVEGGGRFQVDVASGQLSGSARLAAAYTLPIATVLKLSGGFAAQPLERPLLLDPTYGNPSLGPEQSLQLIAAIEQPLPFEALVRLEGWAKWLSRLAVNPDSPAGVQARLAQGLPVFTNDGYGEALGVDGMMVGRTGKFSYSVGLGVLKSERVNPLASGRQRYPTMYEQRFTASASLSFSPTNKWLFTARANFRTGRPYTPITGFVRDELNQRYVPEFGATDSAVYPFFFELGLRGEYNFVLGPLHGAFYLEVLNVTNTTNVYAYSYDLGNYADGQEPQRGAFNHLPIRPFLGVRLEY